MKIVILDGYTENPGDLSWSGFERLGELTVYDRTPIEDEEEIIRRIGDSEIICTNKTPISARTIETVKKLKYIGVLATGYNVVDTEAAREHGIPVTNVPSYGTAAVAQHAIAMLLEICHHVGHHSEAVYEGRWQNNPDFCFWDYPLIELAGKTMGIIGFGRIGQATGRLAQALGMDVLAYDAQKNLSLVSDTCRYVELEDLLKKSDVISLHCPLLPSTFEIINRETIGEMKKGVIIINNSRGQLIDEQALCDALNSGKVYAAGVDVVSMEPIQSDNPLLRAKNCIITPHISWASRESRQRLMDIAVSNLDLFLKGTPVNVVNEL